MIRVDDMGTPLTSTIDFWGNPLFGNVSSIGRSIIHLMITIPLSDVISIGQIITKRPMTFRTLEGIKVSDTRSVSVFKRMVLEVLMTTYTVSRMLSRVLVESVNTLDVKCAKIISFVTHETLAIVDIKHATLNRSFSETILLSDSKYIRALVVRLETLLVSTKVARVVVYLIEESITINQFINSHVIRALIDAIDVGDVISKKVLVKYLLDVIAINQSFYKIIHEWRMALETIRIVDLPKSWYETIIHRTNSLAIKINKEARIKKDR